MYYFAEISKIFNKEIPIPQIIACKTENGIILAADSKAVETDIQGNLTEYSIKRLFQLRPHSTIITGGAMQGAKISALLQDCIGQEQLEDIEYVYTAALPFPTSEYERYMRKACELKNKVPSMKMLPDHFLLHPLRQMDLICFSNEWLAKTIDFDIYAPSGSGGMKKMYLCSNDR